MSWKEFGSFLLVLILVLLVSTGIYAYGMWQYSWGLPWQMQIERQAVKQSQSFVNSQNQAMSSLVVQYNGLDVEIAKASAVGDTNSIDAYKAQERAILGQMCMQIGGMAQGTVAPNVTSFVSSHGGCQ